MSGCRSTPCLPLQPGATVIHFSPPIEVQSLDIPRSCPLDGSCVEPRLVGIGEHMIKCLSMSINLKAEIWSCCSWPWRFTSHGPIEGSYSRAWQLCCCFANSGVCLSSSQSRKFQNQFKPGSGHELIHKPYSAKNSKYVSNHHPFWMKCPDCFIGSMFVVASLPSMLKSTFLPVHSPLLVSWLCLHFLSISLSLSPLNISDMLVSCWKLYVQCL